MRVALEEEHRALEVVGELGDALDDRVEADAARHGPEPHVGLHGDDHAAGPFVLGELERSVEPFEVGLEPRLELLELLRGRLRRAEPRDEIVVGPDDMYRRKDDVRLLPKLVLREAVLEIDPLRARSERQSRLGVEDRAKLAEPLEWVVPALSWAVAVSPLVVARRVHERVVERVEQRLDLREVLVRAETAPRLDVAQVERQPDVAVVVDARHERREQRFLGGAVRRVADDGEGELVTAPAVIRGGTDGQRECGGERTRGCEQLSHLSPPGRVPREARCALAGMGYGAVKRTHRTGALKWPRQTVE
jgi:hypothetical protein